MIEKIILASSSPRRKELLQKAEIPFDICLKNSDESFPPDMPPAKAAEYIAKNKAIAVLDLAGDTPVLAADTIVVYEDKVLGKPKDKQDAFNMLSLLSGKTHSVITGVCLARGKNITTFHEESLVTFYDLTPAQIKHYIATGEPMDKAGAYGIQGKGMVLVKSINGDYYNIVGLPVARVLRMLKRYDEEDKNERI